ncbi:substrate-binding domain-containing protein [Cellulomonas soli]
MKRSKVSLVLTAVVAGVIAASVASPAAADPTPQPRDIVGVGSDTSEFVMNYIADGAVVSGSLAAGYNSAAGSRLVSFDATGSATITPRAGSAAITRPNGSGAGKALLYGAGNNTAVTFARSSSGPSAAEASAGLYHVPFALDTVKAATASTSHAPASLTVAQLVGIYNGTYTNWSQVGGSAGTIVPMLPQTGSGTRSFFLAQLKAANGNVDVVLAGSVQTVQEHDAAPIAANADAVAPFSVARYNTKPGAGIKLEGGFLADRAIYNVVRSADLTKPYFTALFGSDGFICSGAGLPLIEAAGFKQLAHPLDGGECGVPSTSATTNLAVN